MKIFDCFLYNNEDVDLFKIRQSELAMLKTNMVDIVHIACSSEKTFTGLPKELHDFKNLPFNINFCPKFEPSNTPWRNETIQRNCLKTLIELASPQDDDIVIISDYDEIPSAHAVQFYRPEYGLVALQQDMYYFYLNTLHSRQSWRSARIMSWGYLKDKEPDDVRRSGFNLALMHGGQHYSYTGGIQTMLNKFKSFSHQEEAVQKVGTEVILKEKMSRLECPWNNEPLHVVPIDDSMPWYVRSHQEELKSMLYVS